MNSLSYEVLNLINLKRQVTVTWHRNNGPAFLAALGQSAKVPDRIPKEIEGINRKDAFKNITTVLEEHGSEGLRTTINQYESLLLKILSDYDTVNEIVNVLIDEILSISGKTVND